MKLTGKLVLAAVAFTALTGTAMAADLYVPPAAAPVATPVAAPSWNGPYVGATVGYGWYNPNSSANNAWSVGAQLGYNFEVSNPIVLGVQGDINWVGFNQTFGNTTGNNGWNGAVVGRLGYDAGSVMPYVEAGVAFLNINNGPSTNYTGWTAGAGVEFMLADQWSANVEYRYVDYGTGNNSTSDLTSNQIRVGLNYHF